MPLNIQMTIDKTEILIGENPTCRLTLENRGSEAIEIIRPRSGGGMPAFRVVNTRTGADQIVRGNVVGSGIPVTQTIDARDTFASTLPLFEDANWLSPGQYLISSIYEFNNGKGRAESAPVKLTINPMAVRNLFIDSVQGQSPNAVWANITSDPADIVMASIALTMDGGVTSVMPVGQGTLQSRPYVSLPPNGAPCFGNWVAWLDGGKSLHAVHVDPNLEGLPAGQFDLPDAGVIVPPLFAQPNTTWGARGPGDALIWFNDESGSRSVVQRFHMVPVDKKVVIKPGYGYKIQASLPVWMQHHARSDSTRLITSLDVNARKISLVVLPVPEKNMTVTGLQVRVLQTWDGDFIAAGATMDLKDVIRGALLVWTAAQGKEVLELIGWSIGTDGAVSEHYRQALPWAATVPVDEAKVRVRENGVPAVLLKTQDQEWYVFDGLDKLVAAPPPFKDTQYGIDLAFWQGNEVVLIGAEAIKGLTVKRLDGSDLPKQII